MSMHEILANDEVADSSVILNALTEILTCIGQLTGSVLSAALKTCVRAQPAGGGRCSAGTGSVPRRQAVY